MPNAYSASFAHSVPKSKAEGYRRDPLHGMSTIEVLSFVLIIIGAAFIFASFLPARKTWKRVPDELRGRWHIIVYLMYFFFVGYIFCSSNLLMGLKLPVELGTGAVFFG